MSHESEMQRMCVEAREREAEIERLTTLANANAQKCHDLADALATEQRLAVHAESRFAESQVKLAAAQSALHGLLDRITSTPDMSGNFIGTRLKQDHSGRHETSDAVRFAKLAVDDEYAKMALDAAIARAREEGATAMRDAAVNVCRDADVIRSGGFYDTDLGRATLDAAAVAIAALPTNGGRS